MSALLELPEQRDAALEMANGVRTSQVQLKAYMAAMSPRDALREAARILRDDPAAAHALSIYSFLMAIPRFGDTKARRTLTEGWYIWPFKKVRELTERQRRLLAEELERIADPPLVLSVMDEAILVAFADGPCYAADVAESVGIAMNMGSRLYSLRCRGLVEREGLGKRSRWGLSEAGRAVVSQMHSRSAA